MTNDVQEARTSTSGGPPVPTGARSGRGRLRRVLSLRWVSAKAWWGLAGVILFLLIWQWAGTNTNPIFFSTPLEVGRAVPEVLETGQLLSLYLDTMRSFAIGLVGSMVVGISLGILTGLHAPTRHLIDPLAVAAYSTPSLVMIPCFILWFGIGDAAKIALIFFSAVFPALVSTQLGMDQMGPLMRELGRSFGANRREMLTRIILPSIIPYCMTGVRLAVPRAFVAVIAAEMLITAQGVGGLILQYGNQFQTTFYFVPVILVVITSYVCTEVTKQAERRLTPWRR
ncbi:ABC transporter permease [Phytohabitans suffuscus]|uniref:ABC transporter permease n=1 Tax=Phytohabitans suffuscus TaxID=624315 RepID=UPI00156675E7|nr:ABC transporter permease [Phytohabitans suffuscus]